MKGIFKILRRFLPPYKKYVVLTFIFNILTAILNVFSLATIIPILQVLFKINTATYEFIPWNTPGVSSLDILFNNGYWYITQLIETYGSSQTLLILAAVLITMTFFKTLSAYLGSYFTIPIRTGVVQDIRNQINEKILALPIGFFTEERRGDILARISGDVNEVENSIMSSLDMLFKNPILILIYLGTMIALSWELTLFVLVLLPIMGYVMGRVGKTLKRKSFEAQNKWGELMSQVEETLSGLRIIKAFNAEKKISKRFHKGSDEFRSMSNRIARRQYLAHPMSEFLGTITIAIVLWFGGSLILEGKGLIDAATFIYYLTIFYSIINPAKDFSKSAYAVQRGLVHGKNRSHFEAQNEIENPEKPKKLQFNRHIHYNHVWFTYQSDWVLKDINLVIPKGKTIALVGESGSGKSTIVDLLSRFYDIQEGGIYIDDVNIKEVTLHDLPVDRICKSEAILFNDTFFNNIAFGAENATQKVEKAAELPMPTNLSWLPNRLSDQYRRQRGGKLSGGPANASALHEPF